MIDWKIRLKKCMMYFIIQVLVKWYNIYNAPGGSSAHAEWNQFVTCFMTLMGYNTERLTWTKNVSGHRLKGRKKKIFSISILLSDF